MSRNCFVLAIRKNKKLAHDDSAKAGQSAIVVTQSYDGVANYFGRSADAIQLKDSNVLKDDFQIFVARCSVVKRWLTFMLCCFG
jgi:hypothetical protein